MGKINNLQKPSAENDCGWGTAWKYSSLSSPLARLLGFSVLGDTFRKIGASGQYLGIEHLTILKGNLKFNAKLIND